MFYNIRTVINLATRWFINSAHINNQNLAEVIDHFSKNLEPLKKLIPTLIGGQVKQYFEMIKNSFTKKGLPVELASTIAAYRVIYSALNIIEISTLHHLDLLLAAKIYFLIGEKINLLWMRDMINSDSRSGFWNDLARLTLRDELDAAQKTLTVGVMKDKGEMQDPESIIDKWLTKHPRALERWNVLLSLVQSSPSVDYTMYFIAIKELLKIIEQT
jgi:glutamate dehydrogenase